MARSFAIFFHLASRACLKVIAFSYFGFAVISLSALDEFKNLCYFFSRLFRHVTAYYIDELKNALITRLPNRLFQIIHTKIRLRRIDNRFKRRSHIETFSLLLVLLGNNASMKNTFFRFLFSKSRWNGKVDLGGHHIAKFMNGQRGIMGDDGLGLIVAIPAPKRPAHIIFLERIRKLREPENSSVNLKPFAIAAVMALHSIRKPGFDSLLGGKITLLKRCDIKKLLFFIIRHNAQSLHNM